MQKVEALTSQISEFEKLVREAEVVMQSLEEEEAKLEAHKALPKVDVAIGEKLKAKIKSAENPKAVLTFDDVVAQWDMSHKVEGAVSPSCISSNANNNPYCPDP